MEEVIGFTIICCLLAPFAFYRAYKMIRYKTGYAGRPISRYSSLKNGLSIIAVMLFLLFLCGKAFMQLASAK